MLLVLLFRIEVFHLRGIATEVLIKAKCSLSASYQPVSPNESVVVFLPSGNSYLNVKSDEFPDGVHFLKINYYALYIFGVRI